MNTQHAPLEQQRIYGVIRTLLISYGVAAFALLSSRPDSVEGPPLTGLVTPASGLLILGLGTQLLVIAARLFIKRFISDRIISIQALIIVELIGDGATVLLFALGTFGAIIHVADNV